MGVLQWLYSIHGVRIFALILPAVILLEVIMAWSMQTVGPQYDIHLSYFCASCGITQTTSFTSLRSGNDDFIVTCIKSNVLLMLGGIKQEFSNAFLAGVVGHALLILAFQMERGGSIDWEERISSREKRQGDSWHLAGYLVLVVDCILELSFIINKPQRDPNFIRSNRMYTACDGSIVEEINQEVDLISTLGHRITIMRCVTSALVIVCYHRSHDFAHERKETADADSDSATFGRTSIVPLENMKVASSNE